MGHAGVCYPREVLVAYARLAQQHQIYLLVDEIYLASVFDPAPPVPFTSILSIDLEAEAGCDPKWMVHMYAMSKDFGCNGFRVGVALVRDAELYGGVMNGAFACKVGSPSVSFLPRCSLVLGTTQSDSHSFGAQDALWSSLLTSPLLPTYLSLNRSALLAAYTLATSFLASHAIPFTPASAGHFVMADLARFLPSAARPTASTEEQAADELGLMHRLVDGGVYVAPGTTYAMRRAGWFRVTFSVERVVLVVSQSRGAGEADVRR